MKLRLSPDLALPLDAVTEKLAFLGRTGSGKTYAAQKLAEAMHAEGAQFVVLDPVGVWFGLRLAGDGTTPGLPVPVLGGLHGDIPLEATAGALIANLVVDRGVSVVLDVSQFESDADKARFAQAFADRFFFRKKASPSAVHVFIEEAQEFVPQNPQREEARMLHAFTRLEKLGRNFGIGVSLISQRPQEVNKKALNQIELLFAFQMTGPQERKTIQGWIAEKGIDEDIAAELPKLRRGEPHVWSPAWLKISKRVQISAKETFDASSTPAVGKKAEARALSPIDLQRLRTDMAATIEKAKAEDPRELRRQLAEVRADLAKAKSNPVTDRVTSPLRCIEVPILKDAQIKRLDFLCNHIEKVLGKAADWRAALEGSATALREAATEIAGVVRRAQSKDVKYTFTSSPRPPAKAPAMVPGNLLASRPPAAALTEPQQRILDTVAMLNVRGLEVTRESVARWQGIHPNGGSYGTNLGRLRSEGYLLGFLLTTPGQRAARPQETGVEAALRALDGEPKRQILRVLLDARHGLSREELAAKLGIHPNGGSFGTNLGWLRTMGLLTARGPIAVTDGLFR